MSRLGLPSEYDYWLAEYSPIIPQKSITTNCHSCIVIFCNDPRTKKQVGFDDGTLERWVAVIKKVFLK